jgi:hypothetical protein
MKKLLLYLRIPLKAFLLIVFIISPIIFYFIDKKNHILEGWGIYLQSWVTLLICLALFIVLFVFVIVTFGVIGGAKANKQFAYLFPGENEH